MIQTKRWRAGAFGSAAVVLLAGLGLGGCGLGSLTSGIGGGWFGGQSGAKPDQSTGVSKDQLLEQAKLDNGGASNVGGEIALGCPRFGIWSREGHVTIYEPGRVGDGLAVVHRGEISKVSRECQIANGRVTVKYGFAGRVLLGPRGKDGIVSLPLSVFVTDAKRERIVTEKVKVDTAVTLDKPIDYFSIVNTISFPIPEGARPTEFEVYVGFDRNIPGAG